MMDPEPPARTYLKVSIRFNRELKSGIVREKLTGQHMGQPHNVGGRPNNVDEGVARRARSVAPPQVGPPPIRQQPSKQVNGHPAAMATSSLRSERRANRAQLPAHSSGSLRTQVGNRAEEFAATGAKGVGRPPEDSSSRAQRPPARPQHLGAAPRPADPRRAGQPAPGPPPRLQLRTQERRTNAAGSVSPVRS